MGALIEQVYVRLPEGFSLPEELALLLGWIEENGWVYGGVQPVDLHGTPYPAEARVGSRAEFAVASPDKTASHVSAWLGTVEPALVGRLCPFMRTGAEGSYAALWLDDNGDQQIVHLGSGSGSMLACVLGTPLDFLRLLAVGYDELCWNEAWASPPSS